LEDWEDEKKRNEEKGWTENGRGKRVRKMERSKGYIYH
jgi:hypothetical protein